MVVREHQVNSQLQTTPDAVFTFGQVWCVEEREFCILYGSL